MTELIDWKTHSENDVLLKELLIGWSSCQYYFC